jgi:hypothetical protein
VNQEVLRDVVRPRLVERLAPIYAQTFTPAELQASIDFYESPAGRAIVAKGPELAQQMALAMRDIAPLARIETRKRLCSRIDCSKVPGLPPATP